jgi:Mn2+/Fe2+ NRAMP family transporter
MAAEALRPIAGEFAFLIFVLGIIGTGLMAVPVLEGSAAYAVGEALRWPVGLARRPKEARASYGALVAATAIGTTINFVPIDPIRALYSSAVIYGVMAAPIIVVMMNLASSHRVMARFTLPAWSKVIRVHSRSSRLGCRAGSRPGASRPSPRATRRPTQGW